MKSYFGTLMLGSIRWILFYSCGDITPAIKHDAEKLLSVVEMIANANAPINIRELLEAELKDLEGE